MAKDKKPVLFTEEVRQRVQKRLEFFGVPSKEAARLVTDMAEKASEATDAAIALTRGLHQHTIDDEAFAQGNGQALEEIKDRLGLDSEVQTKILDALFYVDVPLEKIQANEEIDKEIGGLIKAHPAAFIPEEEVDRWRQREAEREDPEEKPGRGGKGWN